MHIAPQAFKSFTTRTLPLVALCFVFLTPLVDKVDGQRSLLHWRRDLEYRLRSYGNQRKDIDDILASSIYAPTSDTINGPAHVLSNGNVRFFDLIIPSGSLILDSHVARPTVRILINKTESYVNSKTSELNLIQNQLFDMRRKMHNSSQKFVYKGLPLDLSPKNQDRLSPTRLNGVRVFKQFMHGRHITSQETQLRRINMTSVDHVINETYLENQQIGAYDSKRRIFYEGRKTFLKSVFTKELKSGCCDRLKPIHTSHMMTRSTNQNVLAPVMFQTHYLSQRQPVRLVYLETSLGLYNRLLAFSTIRPGFNLPELNELLPSPSENYVNMNNLIGISQSEQLEILKTIVFQNVVMIDHAHVRPSIVDRRIVIGFASSPGLLFDLFHENHLLKFSTTKNFTPIQYISGRVVVNGDLHIVSGINATAVNQVPYFERFASENIVRIDRPTVIRSPLQFNALPFIFGPYGNSRKPQNVPILHIIGSLSVDLLNGMSIPLDVIPTSGILPLNAPLRIRGPRQFLNQVNFLGPVEVERAVNGMLLPADVIPLHNPDNMNQVGLSSLLFVNGIWTSHIFVNDNEFDDIALQEVHGDAQNLIMQSMFIPLPDGTRLIKAPLRVMHLNLIGTSPERGLLNGFRPQDLIELSNQPMDTVLGRKTFLATVEANECIFNEINLLPNWANHLIRIDRPNTVQTVHTRLAFLQPLAIDSNPNYQETLAFSTSVNVVRFGIEFYPNSNPTNYRLNLDYSPEFYNLYQALERTVAGRTEGRYRITGLVKLIDASGRAGRVNGVDLDDIVTLDSPFRFADRYVMVGKVEVVGDLRAGRITSNYPLDVMDLVQFDKYRIPISGSRAPIRLNNLVLASNNQAQYIQCRMLNGVPFNEFVNSIMSLTRPQFVDNNLVFAAPVSLEGIVRTGSSLNSIKEFKKFATGLKNVRYSFEDGLQCNSVFIKV